jgi:hypothetical protein
MAKVVWLRVFFDFQRESTCFIPDEDNRRFSFGIYKGKRRHTLVVGVCLILNYMKALI